MSAPPLFRIADARRISVVREVAQVQQVVGLGELDPETVVTPGIFVKRVVELPHAVTPR